ncbi:cysteine desulfurase [Rhodobacteraceae bacterium D3-12]|nr:cysteine desulfurase [Rhodobacteraceae bacterium D3-12]
MSRVYMDYNATTPLRPEARAAMVAAMDVVGNPSSVHAEGRAAKMLVEKARAQVAALVGCAPKEVIFTSSATEAAALAMPEFASVCASPVEHDCVLSWSSAAENGAGRLDVDATGAILPSIGGAAFEESLWDDLVAVQAANSETGVLQDTFKLAQSVWACKRDAKILVDAVQAVGKLPFDLGNSGADYVMVSAHKLGGPKGVGALCLKLGNDVAAKLRGGGQEMGRRAGTENVIGIAGFGAAAEAAARDVADGRWEEVENHRDFMEAAIEDAANMTIFIGNTAERLPNTSCIAVPGWKGETQVMQMDLAGFGVSAGSACSSGKVRASTVLTAMGYDEVTAQSAIRVSLGLETTRDEVERFAMAWRAAYGKFRARAA